MLKLNRLAALSLLAAPTSGLTLHAGLRSPVLGARGVQMMAGTTELYAGAKGQEHALVSLTPYGSRDSPTNGLDALRRCHQDHRQHAHRQDL